MALSHNFASIPPALVQMHAEHLARRRRMSAQPVMLPAPAVPRRQIAPSPPPPPPAPPPPPQSALERASAYVSELRRVDRELSDELMSLGIPPRKNAKTTTIRHILRAVSGYYAIALGDIFSASRKQKHVRPRHVAMYLSRRLTGASFPEIGRYISYPGRSSHRDHSTVIHAVCEMSDIDHYGSHGIAAELDEIATALGVTRRSVCEVADAR